MTLKTKVCRNHPLDRWQAGIDFSATLEYNNKVIKRKDKSRLVGCDYTSYLNCIMDEFHSESYPTFDIALKCLNEGVNEYGEIWNLICDTHFNIVGKASPLTEEEIDCLSLMMLGFLQVLSRYEEKANA